ncbi:Bromodomain-containing protein 8 [Channa argus]|uniref:Bromodomain-containing protein 8 n=1 Tax=Channa argus TaxID=215402 RepID=A0A6G1QW08_CHAAH|nr:Bromodomain-containing protein 8 [Channa argus]
MANGVGKHKLVVIGPTEPWSVREKLCLATSVMKSGDQNWVSVSRAIKPFAEPGRPPDWFSQKHCASKYSELLEITEAPKRKRGEKGEVVETVEDVIVRRLTAERIEELKKLIKETQEKHRKLKREAELIHAGHLDSKLEELWEDILQLRDRPGYYHLIGEVDMSTGNMTGAHDLQLSLPSQPLSQATGAPMLSRLLEAGPTQFSAPLGFVINAESASSALLSTTTPIPLGSSASTGTEDKVLELSEEDVTVSYMGDELDLKTVGDIIAIIEEKADEAAEALDAAAVEAALSLCEENGHALSGAWETGPFQPQAALEDGALTERHPKEMKAEVGINVGRGENASGTKAESELSRPDMCGEEEGDGVEGFMSEPDGETELEPAASERIT